MVTLELGPIRQALLAVVAIAAIVVATLGSYLALWGTATFVGEGKFFALTAGLSLWAGAAAVLTRRGLAALVLYVVTATLIVVLGRDLTSLMAALVPILLGLSSFLVLGQGSR